MGNDDVDFLDKLIGALIALFILSVITEKAVSLIRKYPTQCQLLLTILSTYFFVVSTFSFFNYGYRWYYLVSALLFIVVLIIAISVLSVKLFRRSLKSKQADRNTVAKKINYMYHKSSRNISSMMNPLGNIAEESPEEEKVKEITLLSFLAGLVVAFMFQADMIGMLITNRDWATPWEESLLKDVFHFNPDLTFSFRIFFGVITTGFFLSFGSKFFHDLIDNLMEAKDLKRKLNRRNEVQTIEQVDELITYSEADEIILAISQNETVLKNKFPNIAFLDDSVAVINGDRTPVVAIYVNDSNTDGIPARLSVRFPSGRVTTVPTEIVTEFTFGTVTGGMEGEVANSISPGFRGSGCCVMKNGNGSVCLITNCHVMTEGDLDNPQFHIDTQKKQVMYEHSVVGTWKYGKMDKQNDFAYIELDDPDTFMSNNQVEFFKGYREIKPEDRLTLKVTAKGNVSKTVTEAFIIDVVKNKIGIKYNFGQVIIFDEVILVGDRQGKDCRPVNDHGDSGGSVSDSDGNLIGMITGKNDRFTLVLPVQKTAAALNLKPS
jgi:hypothetical protein